MKSGWRTFVTVFFTFYILLSVCGCGGASQIPVSGKLIVRGQVFKPEQGVNVAINFHAKSGSAFGVATLADSGEYTVSCNGKPGLPPGDYIVTVSINKPSNPKDPYSLPTSIISEDYSNKSLGKITMTVQAGAAPGSYDIKIDK